jgi:hypothetical protein
MWRNELVLPTDIFTTFKISPKIMSQISHIKGVSPQVLDAFTNIPCKLDVNLSQMSEELIFM